MLDVKCNYKGKFKKDNLYCEGCLNKDEEETQEHIFSCPSLSSGELITQGIKYNDLFSENVNKQKTICEILRARIKKRNELMNKRKC